MAEFCKITEDGQAFPAPNPLKIVISNPSDERYRYEGWLERKYTEPPEYDPETQYLTEYWVEQTVKGIRYATQTWVIHNKEESVSEV